MINMEHMEDNTVHLETLPLPAVYIDSRRLVTAANQMAQDALSPVPMGRDLAQFIRNPQVLDACEAVRNGGGAMTIKVCLTSRGNRTFEIRLSPFGKNQQTGDAGVIMVFFETTAVVEAQKMRSTFVADASHELRSPLTTLIGALETISGKAGNDAETRARFVKLMQSEADRMKNLIDDLLHLSRTEVQQHIVPTSIAQIDRVIARASERMQDRARAKGCEIVINNTCPNTTTLGDEDQLYQVFQNLLDNAVKYGASDSPITISITKPVAEILGGPDGVQVSVCNQGPAIAPEHLPRLTDRFYRVDEARSRQAGGTGLGLAIVKHILNRHRARLLIRSDQKDGTCFSVVFPTQAAK